MAKKKQSFKEKHDLIYNAARYAAGGIMYDKSTWSLILVNIITIAFAITYNWSFGYVAFLYWMQAAVIGVFQLLRLIFIKKYSVKGMSTNGKPDKPGFWAKFSLAILFFMLYGVPLIVMFAFIGIIDETIEDIPRMTLLILTATYFANHLFSFLYNRKNDSQKNVDLPAATLAPILRLIPMFYTLPFAFMLLIATVFSSFLLNENTIKIISLIGDILFIIFFMGIKTLLDVITHLYEHFGEKSLVDSSYFFDKLKKRRNQKS